MSDTLVFADESEDELPPSPPVMGEAWKVLVVDDEKEVHSVTELVLKNFEFENRPIKLVHAYSAKEAKAVLEKDKNFSIGLIDVVMESDHAGLDLVQAIREELDQQKIRLVLRTGQPGQAPEETVISRYDINDYKEKTELTNTKLKTLMYSTLRAYRDLDIIDRSRRGLGEVIRSTGQIAETFNLNRFASAVLEQISHLLSLGNEALYCQLNPELEALAAEHYQPPNEFTILAATQAIRNRIPGQRVNDQELPKEVLDLFERAMKKKSSVFDEGRYVGYYRTLSERENLLYVAPRHPLTPLDLHLLDIFSSSVGILHERLLHQDDVNRTKRELMYVLGEAVEQRGQIHGNHVRRVAHYAHIIALQMGLGDTMAELMKFAAPLHDIGKVAIPDLLLTKPGELSEDEWTLMKTHAGIGEEILSYSNKPIIKLASKVAGQHHEHWDGQGYPRGLKGKDIHIAARIVGFADFFDGVSFDRCYGKAWPLDKIKSWTKEQSGKKFDPAVVEAVEAIWDDLVATQDSYPNEGPKSDPSA